MKIAVFGSAFNPPQRGHFDVISKVSNDYDLVILVPSFAHAFGKVMADYDYRLEILKVFANLFEKDNVIISDIERELSDGKEVVYTYDVLKALSQNYKAASSIEFIIGPDNEENWDKFYKAQEIKDQWGYKVYPETVKVRSTIVRELLASKDFNVHYLERLVPTGIVPLITKDMSAWQSVQGV